ncbi:head-tail adaptor protein [Pseudomonas sp. HMWF021]|uniref:head-tail adaptor protein n=1 Tax=Pseudomonas sp. HMWF021 TaxID=2056857 RepID=UPI000D3BB6BF|nr:head-tail adaptor protein [Pseudomonas sp. HMWF021]PTT31900.1 head-tail adaptor protein [Pseudomonas sp. HMWF021]
MAYREPGAGELDKHVTLRRRDDAPSADMGLESLFSHANPRWAKIEFVGSVVYTGSAQTENKITHRIFLRFRTGITTAYEVVHQETLYRVKRGFDLNGRRRFVVLEVEELGLLKSGGGIYV